MGSKWTYEIILKKVKANRCFMSSALFCLLNAKSFIPDALTDLKDTILPAAGNRYRTLCNISHLFNPKLKDTDYQRIILRQKQQESFGMLINRFQGYFMREQQYKHQFAKREKTELLLLNLSKTHCESFLQCYNTRYKSCSSRRTIHYDLKYSNLAHTLVLWAKDT